MKILIAIDSLKGSLGSTEAGEAAAEGIRRAMPEAEIEIRPLADGGEGTVDALLSLPGSEERQVTVCGPRRGETQAKYGVLPDGTAVMEMAQAAGLPLLAEEERDPTVTTTYGVGEMMLHAIRGGCRHLLMGIGGSATNDGGIGMLTALGWRFLDERGESVPDGARGLALVARVDDSGVPEDVRACRFSVACDVTNPLCGERGCAAVYGPQKGARAEDIPRMDAGMAHFAAVTARALPHADPDAPGAGAAGGLGFALRTYLGATLTPGVELILAATDMAGAVRDADVVVTGEGRLDAQTAMGKAPAGIAALAKTHGKPVIALSGCLGKGAQACNACGIDAYFPILPAPMTVEEAMEPARARRHVADTAEQIFRLIARFLA
ncbi:MAG: glycerate kinase [Clostridia bacterium]|nr:glycerate kinase [Clostridia bacterium]